LKHKVRLGEVNELVVEQLTIGTNVVM
jgi:hypothetical protein